MSARNDDHLMTSDINKCRKVYVNPMFYLQF